MDEWLQRQAPLEKSLANALIAATPETWAQAAIEVVREQEGGHEKMSIEISSPEGRREVVDATEDIYTALYGLSDLFRERGTNWRKLVCFVSANEAGNWAYRVKYEY